MNVKSDFLTRRKYTYMYLYTCIEQKMKFVIYFFKQAKKPDQDHVASGAPFTNMD